MLQGSLDDFALPEVLSLLASTRKSGELQVSGDRGTDGRVWLDGGRIVCSEVGLSTDVVDTLFELLRMATGTFAFSGDVAPPAVGEARDIVPLLAEAQSRLEEWRTIEAVVPSLASRVALAADLPGEDAIVNAAQWKVLVAVANGGTVDAVATSLELGEFGACKAVKNLVDAGLVLVDPVAPAATGGDLDVDSLVQFTRRGRRAAHSSGSSAGASGEAAEEPAPAAADELSALADAAADTGFDGDGDGDAAPAAHALARQLAQASLAEDGVDGVGGDDDEQLFDENGEPINRSLLLKFLSSVRN
jgi:hypothetical protein